MRKCTALWLQGDFTEEVKISEFRRLEQDGQVFRQLFPDCRDCFFMDVRIFSGAYYTN